MKNLLLIPVIFLVIGCTSTHKLSNKDATKESTVDKSVTVNNEKNITVTKEKADTIIHVGPDSANVNLFVPSIGGDDSVSTDKDYSQSIETDNMKITIHAKPVYKNGKKTGTDFSATAIKKDENFHVAVEKETVSNTVSNIQTKNDITNKKEEKKTDKKVDKARTSFVFIICIFIIIILVLYALYRQLKKQYL